MITSLCKTQASSRVSVPDLHPPPRLPPFFSLLQPPPPTPSSPSGGRFCKCVTTSTPSPYICLTPALAFPAFACLQSHVQYDMLPSIIPSGCYPSSPPLHLPPPPPSPPCHPSRHTHPSVTVSCTLTCSSNLFEMLSSCCICLHSLHSSWQSSTRSSISCRLHVLIRIYSDLLLLISPCSLSTSQLTLLTLLSPSLQSQLHLVSHPGRQVRANRQVSVRACQNPESTWNPLLGRISCTLTFVISMRLTSA